MAWHNESRRHSLARSGIRTAVPKDAAVMKASGFDRIVEDLRPVKQESFYGKAKVITTPSKVQLKSYDTIVAEIDRETNMLTINGWYSSTTARHINAFLHRYGYDDLSKKEMQDFKPEYLKRISY